MCGPSWASVSMPLTSTTRGALLVEQRAGHGALAALGLDREADQGLIALGLLPVDRGHRDVALARDDRRVDRIDAGEQRREQALEQGRP